MSEALSEESSVGNIGLWRATLRVWLCAGALGRSALAVEPGLPEASMPGSESARPEHDRAEPVAPLTREPAYGRAAFEMLGVLAIGTAQYWMNVKTNSRDWDYPEWSNRFDTSAVRFDNNTHVTNNVLHPLAGAAYYGLSRANGLSVGASALYTLASSTVWEWGLEWREKVSINDMFATTLGGIAIGEFLTQLGFYLNSAPSTTSAHDVAKATLGFPVWIHDRLDRRLPEPPAARDRLGLSATYRHRFTFAYENHWLESPDEPGLELRGVTLDGSLASLPGFLVPETFATTFAQGDFSTGSLGLHFDGHGLREADVRVEAVLAGYYAQRANPGVMGALLGLATGFEFASKTTLKPGDEYALVHVFGPELRATWKGESYHFDVRLRAFADFAAIRCLAWPMVGVRDPEAKFKSSLEQKYQYHAGVASRISAALRFHAARLSADFGFGTYRSIQGLDRFQEQITRDIPGTEVLEERRVEFALEPPGTLIRLYGELAANSHESSLGGETGERNERRWLLGAGVAF
jgi:hypothetical protein